MIDTKALELLGLQEKDFQPQDKAQEKTDAERIAELEAALNALIGGDTE